MIKNIFFFFCLAILLTSCSNKKGELNLDLYKSIPFEFQNVLKAHGGLDKWQSMASLTFNFTRGEKKEIHQIDLKSRKTRIDSDDFSIIYDGLDVWVSPNKEAFPGSSARFYHNLMFYFYAMPFVLADPGIQYTNLEPKEILGKMFNRISIKYDSGIGDAPDDEYIICFDPETNKMEWLFYTVTYFSKEKGNSYNAIHYDKWGVQNGLLLPETMAGFKTNIEGIGDKRYENIFENIKITSDPLDQNIFKIPESAEIDSLK